MLTLHYKPGTASLTPHMILNEIGAPFELALVDTDAGAQRSPEYLRLNPNGRIPTLVDGSLVVYETAAIVLHLVDRFPEADLAPAVGTDRRAHFYRWIAHLSCSVQPELRTYFYPEQHALDPAGAPDAKAVADRRLVEIFARLDAQVGEGPYLLGQRFTAADAYLLMLVRWGRFLTKPPRDLPNLARHAERVLARPAIRSTFEAEALAAPWI